MKKGGFLVPLLGNQETRGRVSFSSFRHELHKARHSNPFQRWTEASRREASAWFLLRSD